MFCNFRTVLLSPPPEKKFLKKNYISYTRRQNL